MSTTSFAKKSSTPPPASMGLPPQLVLARMMSGYAVSQLIYVVVKLGIPDLLADGPLTLEELTAGTKAHPQSLLRLMRGVAAVGLFEEVNERQFALTALGQYLRADVPDSLAPMALFSQDSYQAWGHLLHAVETGETAFPHVFGVHRYQYLEQHPDAAVRFNAAMSVLSSQLRRAVVAAYDFSRFKTAVDVGGGQGGLLLDILQANSTLRGILFDTASVVQTITQNRVTAGVAERCKTIAGDFFKAVPGGGDVYLLAHVIHNWDDDQSSSILENCAQGMDPQGTLLIIEMIMPEQCGPSPATYPLVMTDLQMLVMTGGRERTEAEFRALLERAGFELKRIIPTQALESIIECVRST
ncbi:MAG TPA: methyltransferase [Pyrinomonadaceae bacterium]|nr:methyltransferase [Pyrinomonadaceae bacterium]